eukprot:scaffold28365_cov78-Skeletonema_dohrnii-CCMP3373.AAC.1
MYSTLTYSSARFLTSERGHSFRSSLEEEVFLTPRHQSEVRDALAIYLHTRTGLPRVRLARPKGELSAL